VTKPYWNGPPSDHFDGTRFFIPGHTTDRPLRDILRWRFTETRAKWPAAYPSPFADATPPQRVDGLRVTLIGHASFLVQLAGQNILIDPVWSPRASPLRWLGPSRINPPGVTLANLPPIDAILITHCHYDHLDLATIARLWRRSRPRIIAPLGNDVIIRRAGADIAVETLDWGEATTLGDIKVHVTPALHWSARGLGDRRMALWCAFVLRAGTDLLYHAGDTGYGDGTHFRDIRARHGTPNLALLPIGAYEPRWFMRNQHMNPTDSVRALADLGAPQALGYHWGTFQLTDEAIDAPPKALATALANAKIDADRFRALRPGESWSRPET
jgi:L-ascorbate metabolism protein UlaG (beta-lactamase superfamily)